MSIKYSRVNRIDNTHLFLRFYNLYTTVVSDWYNGEQTAFIITIHCRGYQ